MKAHKLFNTYLWCSKNYKNKIDPRLMVRWHSIKF